jgi:predicted glutamine amidotransferase
MCLLVQQTATSNFTDELLSDVYAKNKDGLGVMYAEDGQLHIFKCLPANAQDFIDFYRKHADGKYCVWHARMQTHGDIDFDNCHPYKVTDDIWLAHNGILSTGNDWDEKKSDTWHFIDKFVKPALIGNPDLLTNKEWQEFVGGLIGTSNKFALVRSDGEMVVINAKAGVNYANAWLSNTYAWPATKYMNAGKTDLMTNYPSHRSSYSGYDYGWDSYKYSKHTSYDDREHWERSARGYWERDEEEKPVQSYSPHQIRPYVRAAFNQWMRKGVSGVEQWVCDAPYKAVALLTYWYDDIDEVESLVNDDPFTAAEWIADLFDTDAVSPSLIN